MPHDSFETLSEPSDNLVEKVPQRWATKKQTRNPSFFTHKSLNALDPVITDPVVTVIGLQFGQWPSQQTRYHPALLQALDVSFKESGQRKSCRFGLSRREWIGGEISRLGYVGKLVPRTKIEGICIFRLVDVAAFRVGACMGHLPH